MPHSLVRCGFLRQPALSIPNQGFILINKRAFAFFMRDLCLDGRFRSRWGG